MEIIFAAGLIIALFSQAARAQSVPKSSTGSNENVIAIEFQPGPLEDYIKAVKAQRPKANIVIDAALEKLLLPRASLPAVSISQGLEWVIGTAAARDRGIILQTTRSGRAEPDDAIFLFTTDQRAGNRPQTTTEERQVKSFSLKDSSLNSQPPEKILKAIEDALKLQNPNAGQNLKYNADVGLLFVQGAQRELAIVSGVLDAIRQTQRQDTATQLRDEIEKLKKEFDEFKKTSAKAVK